MTHQVTDSLAQEVPARNKSKSGAKKAQAMVPYQTPKSTLELIAQAARDPSVDVAKLRELLAIRKEQEDREAELAFNEALRKAQSEIPRMRRDKKADKYWYTTLESITKVVNPIITANGFSLSYGTADSPITKHYRITCDLSHTAGHTRKYFVDIPADTEGDKGTKNKSDTKAFGSTMSYGRRYLIVMIFNIAITNEDDDGAAASGAQTITQKQADEIRDLLESTGAPRDKFLKWAGVEKAEDILAEHFDSCTNAIRNFKKGAK